MKKPNFKKLSSLWKEPEKSLLFMEAHWGEVERHWALLVDDSAFKNLLHKYKLTINGADLAYLGLHFAGWQIHINECFSCIDNRGESLLELLDAVNILQAHPNYSIIIRGKENEEYHKEALTISNPDNLKELAELFNKLFERKLGEFNSINETGKGEEEKEKSPRGRKEKQPELGMPIDFIQRYLQENSCMVAKEGHLISREQSRFIADFLVLLGMASKQDYVFYKEDRIYVALKKIRGKR